MHEISLCEGMLEIFEKQATEQNYSTVKTVFLEIGKLSSFVRNKRLYFNTDCDG